MGSTDGEEGGHLPAFTADDFEAELHDISRLPHMHSESEIKKFFPTIHAAPPCPNSVDWNPDAEEETSNSHSDKK